jgi:hypothetical protein
MAPGIDLARFHIDAHIVGVHDSDRRLSLRLSRPQENLSLFSCNECQVLWICSDECAIQSYLTRSVLACFGLRAYLSCFAWGDWLPWHSNR